jgi:two-component system cell cycle sensor histidine kinase/response regulator CckA
MTKQEYIKLNIVKLMHQWISMATGIGSLVIIAFCLLDYLVTPSNFKIFLFYRIIAAIGIFLLHLYNRRKIDIIREYAVTIISAIIASTMIALMISKFGGHQSPYFAGMIITIFLVVGLTSLDVIISIINSFIIYAIYLIPILLYDTEITNKTFFINSNFFILSTIFATVTLRYLIQQRFISEFGLQYDLDQKKKKLEDYSSQLEDLVQERTKELTVSEQRFRALFDNANDGVVVLDKNGNIINMNNKFCELHGFEKEVLIGTNFKLLEVEDKKEEKEEKFKRILNGEPLVFETEHYRKDGSRILLEVSSKGIEIGEELFIQSLHRDITEKKAIQEQLIHSQKMESVGQLAGGIAHNFNNLLTAILGYAELLQEYSDLDDESKQRVNSIEGSARKAGVLVSKLMSFSRREAFEILPLNLNDVINDSVKLLEGVLDKRIGLKTTMGNIPTIEGDPNQLEQVIMNLMVNARDAMPDGGLISIKTSVIEIERDRFNMPTYIMPGSYVLLMVSDTGSGIPKEIINKIFDPFFTTKEKGKGTGLGLATVYGIVKDHKGYVTVQSEVDKGTTFEVYFPVSGKAAFKAIKPKLFSVSGHENILLVDDEEEVLNFIRDILETHGYKVIPARNPLAAIDTFKKLSNSIHLVITDIVMPLMQGKELIQNLKTIKPDIKIVAISGYSDEKISRDNTMIDEFIKKPFEVYQLLSSVRRVLDTGIKEIPPY